MPAINNGKILVTGASGFVAAWVCKTLLENSFEVVGTVRTADKGDYLVKKLKDLVPAGKFSYIVVEDIGKADAFDEAVKGVDAIMHTASPFHTKATDPQELYGPAIQGTTGILESAHKYNNNVKRVIVTSSIASIISPVEKPTTFTEQDWNDDSPNKVSEGNSSGGVMYMASKSLAERAAWTFVEEKKPSFDLVTVCPPLILGPLIHEVKSAENLNTSSAIFYDLMKGEHKEATIDKLTNPMPNIVDVRDVATTHYLCLTSASADGRYISASDRGFTTLQDLSDTLKERAGDDKVVNENVPRGTPGAGKKVVADRFANDKAKKELKQSFFSQEDTAVDTFKSLKEYSKAWN